jgi:hypothetical protein
LQIIKTEVLIDKGPFSKSAEYAQLKQEIETTIKSMVWPPGADTFSIYGAKHANGVVPIKEMFVDLLVRDRPHWQTEVSLTIPARKKPGPIDVAAKVGNRLFAVEWETGNISSSHRAMNKLAMGLLHHVLNAGFLITPTRKMYAYLTDRTGNLEELSPYFDILQSTSIDEGVLGVIAVEHDSVSQEVPKFPKGTDGRALR